MKLILLIIVMLFSGCIFKVPDASEEAKKEFSQRKARMKILMMANDDSCWRVHKDGDVYRAQYRFNSQMDWINLTEYGWSTEQMAIDLIRYTREQIAAGNFEAKQ